MQSTKRPYKVGICIDWARHAMFSYVAFLRRSIVASFLTVRLRLLFAIDMHLMLALIQSVSTVRAPDIWPVSSSLTGRLI